MPMADRAMANEIAISANPLRMAQFFYDLVMSTVADIIPLAVRATQDSRDREAVREILAVFNNKLYQARDAYYGAITLGMMQVSFLVGCNIFQSFPFLFSLSKMIFPSESMISYVV